MSRDETRASGEFGALVRRHRMARGLSQDELAERAGLTSRTIANLERGRTSRPYRSSVQAVADALGLPEAQRIQLDRASRTVAERVAAAAPVAARPAAAAAQPPPGAPHQLPAAVPHFAGRVRELGALTAIASQAAGSSAAMVIAAIAGTAGVGKTALAVHWAHQAAGQFPDGQLYVNLRGYDQGQPMTATDALAGFLRALGVHGPDIPPEPDERAARYRSLLAGRRMVILLDNASDVEQVRPLLPGTPGCVVLVTSRDALAGLVARDGARRLDLDLLPPEDAVSLLRALIGSRADDGPAAMALAGYCCLLPLALRVAAELAIARPDAPLADLAGELSDQQRRLDLLDAGGDSRTAVRAVFYCSYRHLDAAAGTAFLLLGLHPGADLDLYAAAALVGTAPEQARRLLDQLSRAHLIHSTGPDRWAMHDLLRAYARDLAQNGDPGARNSEPGGQNGDLAASRATRPALSRLLDHYLYTAALAMDALEPAEQHRRPRIDPPGTAAPPVTSPDAARGWLDAERENLTTAAAYAADHGWPDHAIRLATTVFRYLDVGGHYGEATAIHGHARRAARDTGDRAAEAAALTGLGGVDLRLHRYQRAARHFRQALERYRQTGDRSGEARSLNNLGIVELQQGSYQQATDHYQRALALFRLNGDQSGEVRVLNCLGEADLRQGRYQQAVGHLAPALDLCRQIGDRSSEAYAQVVIGEAELRQGRSEQAAGHLVAALALFREIGDRAGEAYALGNLGGVDLRQGRYQAAARQQEQALALFREIADQAGEASALNGLGSVLVASGRAGDARTQHAAALAVATQIGDKHQQARAHHGLGDAHHAAGEAGQARSHWRQARTLYAELGAPEADQVLGQLSDAAPNVGASN
jgi:tetratricopeptide (TPR) repeat protein/transcriptional regulator with XRE-family HTH domain